MKSQYMIHEVRAIADLTQITPSLYELNRINVPAQFRRKGYGTQLMQMLLADADAEGAAIRLWINAYGEMTEAQLRNWYTKYGWVTNLDGTMFRPARTV